MLNSDQAGHRPKIRLGWVASIRQESRRFVDRIAGDSAVGQWFATQLSVRAPPGTADAAA
jgi:hypothetical protein